MNIVAMMPSERAQLLELMELVCQISAVQTTLDPVLLQKAEAILGPNAFSGQKVSELQQCYEICEQKLQSDGKLVIFEMTEEFMQYSHKEGRDRRLKARKVAALQEIALTAEVAQLKCLRSSNQRVSFDQEMQQKIGDGERAYLSRKLVVAKAAQVASSECRLQFAMSRSFMETLHIKKQDNLHRQYKCNLFMRMIINHFQRKDDRACALEEQIERRIYEKKKADTNEHHMAQNLEEAEYMESVLGLLDKVQAEKEERISGRCVLQRLVYLANQRIYPRSIRFMTRQPRILMRPTVPCTLVLRVTKTSVALIFIK